MSESEQGTDSSFPEASWRLKQTVPEVKELEALIKCSICYEPQKNPVTSIKCQHTYCSLCVRKYLQYKQQCPSCIKPLHETDLKPNRSLSEVFEVISRLFPRLESLAKEVNPGSIVPLKSSKNPAVKTSNPQSQINKLDDKISEPSPSKSIKAAGDFASPSTSSVKPGPSKTPIKTAPFSSLISKETNIAGPSSSTSEITEKKVPCPVCQVEILQKNVNSHLDRCLAEQNGEVSSKPTRAKNNMKPMSHPVFHLLKDKDIKKRLRDEGLECWGDKNTMIKRLKNFIVIWNSQCDLDEPMSRMQMVMTLQKEERELQNQKHSSTETELNYDAKTDPKVIATQQKAYVEKHKSTFAKLIEKAKASKTKPTESSTKAKSSAPILTQDKNESDIITLDEELDDEISSNISESRTVQKKETTSASNVSIKDNELNVSSQRSNNSANDRSISKSNMATWKMDKTEVAKTESSSLTKNNSSVALTPVKNNFESIDKNATPSSSSKRKFPEESTSTPVTITPKVKRSRHLNTSAKSECPICFNLIPNSLIQHHVNKCLENPRPSTRSTTKPEFKITKVEESSDEENDDEIDTNLLNATPDIITEKDDTESDSEDLIMNLYKHKNDNTNDDLISSAPKQENDANPNINDNSDDDTENDSEDLISSTPKRENTLQNPPRRVLRSRQSREKSPFL